jgi:hypothetical protein
LKKEVEKEGRERDLVPPPEFFVEALDAALHIG